MLNSRTLAGRQALSWAGVAAMVLVMVTVGITLKQHSHASTAVAGQSYQICDQTAQYLTSPYTYHGLSSGSQSYTVAQYQALPGYGTALPALPAYIANESSGTTAAMIFAPGSSAQVPSWQPPSSPIVYFFEGGAYGDIGLATISGDEIIGGSATSFPEPTFNNNGTASGINAQNDSQDSPNNTTPIAHLTSAAAQGATSIALSASTVPEVPWGVVMINSHDYTVSAVSGSQSAGYTLTLTGGLDTAAAANTSVYYDGLSGDVTVSYLDISHDLHGTTGTIYTGAGWTVTHNNLHDSYSTPGIGVGVYGGDQGTIEYNCFSKIGEVAADIFGTNNKFDYNEVYESNYETDPGCGCAGIGKWWGTLNADIVGNAFINNGPNSGGSVWLDNGNSGTLVSGNFFDKSYGSAFANETGYNTNITGNLFQDNGWGTGNGGCGDNCDGAIDLNSSGGFHVPGSRYDNQLIISNNQFVNNWMGINIWQSGGRSCENSGEGWPNDDPYCSGGYPITADPIGGGGQYYFSHRNDATTWGGSPLAQAASAGSTTVLVPTAMAINDYIGFGNPVQTTTSSTTNVSALNGSGTINATSTAGFPSSGQLRVGTSAAWSDAGGSFTGAILAYTGTTSTSFTGVSLVRGSGTLAGPVLQVQPYKVLSQTCYANDCAVTVSPALAGAETAGTEVSNAGTCQMYATSAATPTQPLASNGTSYYDGCQWSTRNISVNGNSFSFDAAAIAAGTTVSGQVGTSCTAAHANACGTNFMAFQEAGEPPFNDFTGGNAMMSNSLSACPSWDSGCTTNPLSNLNALSNPPAATAHNNEPPENNIWSNNSYSGPWAWNTDWFGSCSALPSDSATGKSMPSSPNACSNVDFAHWQSDWQQDAGSSYSASASPTASATPTPTATANPTSSPSGKLGDINNDGSVNIFDLSTLMSGWGTSNAADDLNHDGSVNVFDLSILLSHWGS